VRRVAYGVGVERTFPIYSPLVEKVEIVRTVRCAGLSSTIYASLAQGVPH